MVDLCIEALRWWLWWPAIAVAIVLAAEYATWRTLVPITPSPMMLELVARSGLTRVRFFTKCLVAKSKTGHRCAAYASWMLGMRVVVIDGWFLSHADPEELRFTVAHELGHLHHRHSERSLLAIITGWAFTYLIADRQHAKLVREELDADTYALELTGRAGKPPGFE